MPAGIRHPFTGALYEQHDGKIKVTSGDDEGIFSIEGEWVSGDLRECDPQLCGWVGGPQFANHRMSESTKR